MTINREAWSRLADALESGEYEQMFDQLRFRDCFCAAGVACEIFKDDLSLTYRNDDGAGRYGVASGPDSAFLVPVSLKVFLDNDPFGPNVGKIMQWNDVDTYTFKTIARLIREEILEV